MILQYQLDRLWLEIKDQVWSETNDFLGRGLAQGNMVSEGAEQRLAEISGRNHCVLTANCTDALWIALEILKHQDKLQPGFRAAVPAVTWVSTATAVIRAGGTPVFFDINSRWCLDADQDFSNVDIIMAVDLLGNSCEWSKLEQTGKLIVLDAAQSFCTEYQGRKSLQRGHISCTSFSPLKSVTSLGSGGAVFVDDAEQANLARLLRLHFKTNNQDPQRGLGINSTMNAFEVSCLNASLDRRQIWQQRRESIAMYYHQQLGGLIDLSYQPGGPEVNNSLHRIALRHKQRRKIFELLHKDQIMVHPMYTALFSEPVFRSVERHSDCLNSARMTWEGFVVPNQHTLTDAEVEIVCAKIKSYL